MDLFLYNATLFANSLCLERICCFHVRRKVLAAQSLILFIWEHISKRRSLIPIFFAELGSCLMRYYHTGEHDRGLARSIRIWRSTPLLPASEHLALPPPMRNLPTFNNLVAFVASTTHGLPSWHFYVFHQALR